MHRFKDSRLTEYAEGFLAGQAVAYCEMVRLGVRLAGQLDVPVDACVGLVTLIEREGCRSRVVSRDGSRAAMWIYQDERTERLIDALDGLTAPMPTDLVIWGMGKLFGYGDLDVLDYLASK